MAINGPLPHPHPQSIITQTHRPVSETETLSTTGGLQGAPLRGPGQVSSSCAFLGFLDHIFG